MSVSHNPAQGTSPPGNIPEQPLRQAGGEADAVGQHFQVLVPGKNGRISIENTFLKRSKECEGPGWSLRALNSLFFF